jgi:hypothetical protein
MGKGKLDRQSLSPDSREQGCVIDHAPWIGGPFDSGFCFPKSRKNGIAASIPSLFSVRYPSAVAWLVIPVIVAAIEQQALFVSIGVSPIIKGFEIVQPLGADLNPATAPSRIVSIRRAQAAISHSEPCFIKPLAGSMRKPARNPSMGSANTGRRTVGATLESRAVESLHRHTADRAGDRNTLPFAERDSGLGRSTARVGTVFTDFISASSVEFFHRRTADRAGDHWNQYAATPAEMKWETST